MEFSLGSRFFGLTQDYKEVMLEEQFFLVKQLGMNLREILSMPVQYRKWWITRTLKYNDLVNKQYEEARSKVQ